MSSCANLKHDLNAYDMHAFVCGMPYKQIQRAHKSIWLLVVIPSYILLGAAATKDSPLAYVTHAWCTGGSMPSCKVTKSEDARARQYATVK